MEFGTCMLYVDITHKLEINQGVMDGNHPYDRHHPLTTFTTIREFGFQKNFNGQGQEFGIRDLLGCNLTFNGV